MRVRFESLYGTIYPFALPTAFSASTLMQLPNTVRLLLIAQPSFSLTPSAPVCFDFSEPAKSTKLITDSFSVFLPASLKICLNSIVMMVCARLEV